MERTGVDTPIRRASKREFLRLITRKIPPSQWKRNGSKSERVALQRDVVGFNPR